MMGDRDKLGRGGGLKRGDKLLCFPDVPILNPKAISSAQRATTLRYCMAGRGELMWSSMVVPDTLCKQNDPLSDTFSVSCTLPNEVTSTCGAPVTPLYRVRESKQTEVPGRVSESPRN